MTQNVTIAEPHASVDDALHGKHLLDPIDRFSEILFGLIMVLSFTGSLSVATAGRREVWTMLVGAIGCNLAWGIVDAVMYLIGSVTQRRRDLAMIKAVIAAESPDAVRRALLPALHPVLAAAATDRELELMRQRLRDAPAGFSAGSATREDLAAAAAVFALVFFCTFPVVIPFILLGDAAIALRLSNAIALTMLFIAGCSLGRVSGFGPVRTGATMVAIGLALVAVTMALGG